MKVFFKKIFVYGVEWINIFYLRYMIDVKLTSYEKIAVIGEDFCKTQYNPLFGQHLTIYNQGAKSNIQIGNNVILDCKINCNANGRLRIGNSTSIREKSVVNCDNRIEIGNFCFIGDRVLIQDNDSHPELPDLRRRQSMEIGTRITNTYEANNDPIKIADGVWVGTGAIILKGVKIGKNSIIGAGAVVTHDVPAMKIAAGNPAKIVRSIVKEAK